MLVKTICGIQLWRNGTSENVTWLTTYNNSAAVQTNFVDMIDFQFYIALFADDQGSTTLGNHVLHGYNKTSHR